MPKPPFGFTIFANLFSAYNTLRFGKKSMEAIFGQAMKDSAALRKPEVPWKDDEPHQQAYHVFDAAKGAWAAQKPVKSAASTSSADIESVALFSWNIDFMLPFGEARMKPALAHLQDLVRATPSSAASVIFIQECTPSDLGLIANTAWVRERFQLTDLEPDNWATTHYGTVTLVDARLPITAAFRVHYSKTRMDRDALFIDVSLKDDKTLRLCNTHLESLPLNPPYRPAQMEIVAKYLHDPNIHAGLVAGDFNAIQPFDRNLHSDNNLKDAFLELGGKEDSDEGYTWGQQAATQLREQFGCSRMDKVFFCGGMEVVNFVRFGKDVVVEDEEMAGSIVKLGFEKAWVTDHLGIRADVRITEKKDSRL